MMRSRKKVNKASARMNARYVKYFGQIMACSLPVLLSGCAALRSGTVHSSSTNKIASVAFTAPETTALGQTALTIVAGHGDESGFLLLDRGRDALSWRLILADAAQKSIDIQYFLWRNAAAGKVVIQRLLSAAERSPRALKTTSLPATAGA
jgi:putative cardiolipin synthase